MENRESLACTAVRHASVFLRKCPETDDWVTPENDPSARGFSGQMAATSQGPKAGSNNLKWFLARICQDVDSRSDAKFAAFLRKSL